MNRAFTMPLLIFTIMLASGCSPTASTASEPTAPPVSPQPVPTEETILALEVGEVLYGRAMQQA